MIAVKTHAHKNVENFQALYERSKINKQMHITLPSPRTCCYPLHQLALRSCVGFKKGEKSNASEIVLTAVNRLCRVKQPVSQRADFRKQLSVSTSSLRTTTFSCCGIIFHTSSLSYQDDTNVPVSVPPIVCCQGTSGKHGAPGRAGVESSSSRYRNCGVKCASSAVLRCSELQPLDTFHQSSVELALRSSCPLMQQQMSVDFRVFLCSC